MILDSCFLVDLLSGDEAAVVKLDEVVENGTSMAVSALTITEVRRGLGSADADAGFDDVMREVSVVPYDRDTARRAARIHRRLDDEGRTIGSIDGMVAATALERDGRVLTRNVSEFRRIDGLRVVPY